MDESTGHEMDYLLQFISFYLDKTWRYEPVENEHHNGLTSCERLNME